MMEDLKNKLILAINYRDDGFLDEAFTLANEICNLDNSLGSFNQLKGFAFQLIGEIYETKNLTNEALRSFLFSWELNKENLVVYQKIQLLTKNWGGAKDIATMPTCDKSIQNSGNMILINVSSPEEIKLNNDKLYIVLEGGTGDTFNTLILLKKFPPSVPYDLIFFVAQTTLIYSLLSNFESKPDFLYAVAKPRYYEHLRLIKEISIANDACIYYEGSLPCLNKQGLLSPRDNDIYELGLKNPEFLLTVSDVNNWRETFASLKTGITNKINFDTIVLFFPAANGTEVTAYPDFSNLVKELKKLGHNNLFTNISSNNYSNEITIEGTKALSLNHAELLELVYSPSKKIHLIGIRSGAFDLLRYSNQKALVFYGPLKIYSNLDNFDIFRFKNTALGYSFDLLEVKFDVNGLVDFTYEDCLKHLNQ